MSVTRGGPNSFGGPFFYWLIRELDSVAGVSLENVSKRFAGTEPAVDQLTLTIEDREFLVLVGPSGCGKSTTLRMIAGLETLSDGSIRIGDRVVNDTPPKDRDVAMVFQSYALYPHMTVFENLAFSLRLRYGGLLKRVGLWITDRSQAAAMAEHRRRIPERVQQAAKTLGIESLLSRKPGQLSGGERQRVALGRAIVRRPAVFLFDEPLSNLDAKLRGEMRREIKSLHRQLDATMVYVTHDQVEALTLGDRIVVMHQGRIQQVGSPLEVYHSPANRFVASFIGSPPMNLLPGTLREEQGRRWFTGAGLEFTVDHAPARVGAVICGIRPEHVTLQPATDGALQIEMVEMLGESSIVHARPPGEEVVIVSKAGSDPEVAVGEQAAAVVDSGHCHWFDPETGDRLETLPNTPESV